MMLASSQKRSVSTESSDVGIQFVGYRVAYNTMDK
jgi:hypothetical protein